MKLQGFGIAGFLIVLPFLLTWVFLEASYEAGPKLDLPVTLPACEEALSNPSEEITEHCRNNYDNRLRILNAAYDMWSLNDRGRAFGWQRLNGVVLFIAALSILVFGFFLTWKEFEKDRETPVELEIGATGVKVSSEVIGIVILVIALSFTYLYIDRIYPISEIGSDGKPNDVGTGSDITSDSATAKRSRELIAALCADTSKLGQLKDTGLDGNLINQIEKICAEDANSNSSSEF